MKRVKSVECSEKMWSEVQLVDGKLEWIKGAARVRWSWQMVERGKRWSKLK